MEEAVKADVEVMTNYSLLTSIKGIGPVNAVAAIVSTDNFRAFDNPRQYACYIGVAPFPNTSGTSVRGRTKGVKAGHGGHKGQNNAGRTLRNNIR